MIQVFAANLSSSPGAALDRSCAQLPTKQDNSEFDQQCRHFERNTSVRMRSLFHPISRAIRLSLVQSETSSSVILT